MPAADQILDLAAEQSQPRVPVPRGGPACGLPARIAAMISSCVNPNSVRAVLWLSVAPLRPPSGSGTSGAGLFLVAALSTGWD